MKTQLVFFSIMISIISTKIQSQQRTIVNATNSEISDNLDLRAISSVFGESNTLQDFERRLNDPRLQISNLDLNNDNQVDYLRVIEYVKNKTHIVVIQCVVDNDLYQDIATIEVEKDNYKRVHLQIVGNSYLYGHNYIYEPVYHKTPILYTSFWKLNYRPYVSIWRWNNYPRSYYSWNPFPVFRYRNNIHNCLNNYNTYNYVSNRRSTLAVSIYNSRRANGYEKQYPNYSFSIRNKEIGNRYELEERTNSNRYPRTGENSTQNRTESTRASTNQRSESPRVYSENTTRSQNVNSYQRKESTRITSDSKTESNRENSSSARNRNKRD